MKHRMSKIAAAVAAAMMTSSAGAVVVVGGDNGWEVSFDGFVNAFYTHFNQDDATTVTRVNGVAGAPVVANGEDASRVHSGFLPSFFSFNVKSPTVNGLTGKARLSIAPTIHTAKSTNSVGTDTLGASGGLQGATIDLRENFATVEGSFGAIQFGRTLSLFGRKAILNDMTLFGVGNVGGNADFGSVTAGRIGHGYLYPDFQPHFSYATPDINGFKAEVGAYDPVEPGGAGVLLGGPSTFETNMPRLEGEISYATSFTNGSLLVWGDGMWQEVDEGNTDGDPVTAGNQDAEDLTVWGVGGGAQIGYLGFQLTGYYQITEGTPLGLGKVGDVFGIGGATVGPVATLGTVGAVTCGILAGATTATCDEAEQDAWYVQGTYSFGQGTKVGFSYGESSQDGTNRVTNLAGQAALDHPEVELNLWSIGVYHDVNAWLKLIAEYNNESAESEHTHVNNVAATTTVTSFEDGWDAFSVGAFVLW